MYKYEDLLEDLYKLGIDKNSTLLVHSSMKSIGEVHMGADTVLDALMEHMKDGLLVFPTHTWAYINASNPKYYVEDSKVCVGILPELFRKRKGVVRSLHPTHSVAAIGKGAEEFISGNELFDTPCARRSPWGKLLDMDANIMLIGVDLRRNTFIHGVEEWADIPGRLTDEQEMLYTITKEGREIEVPSRRHSGHWSENFDKLDDFFLKHKAMRIGKFGDSVVRICKAKAMTELLYKLLAQNPDLFKDNTPFEEDNYVI